MSPVKSPEELSTRDVRKKDKIVVQKDEAEEILPGWTKEVKIRKTGSATKVDRYYTDPVTGYIFRSLKDVQRYLKTGELGRLAIKPKMERREETGELKEQMGESLLHKRASKDKSELPARASKRLAGIDIDAPPAPSSPSQPKTRQATRLAGIKVEAQSQQEPKIRQAPEPKTRQATRLAEMAIDESLPSPPEPKTHQALRLADVDVAVDASLTSSSPLESKAHQATQLAGISVDEPLPEPKTHQTIRLAEMAVDTSPRDTRTNYQATSQSGIGIDASVASPPTAAPKTRQAARKAEINSDSPPPLPSDSKTRQAKLLTGTELGPSHAPQPEPKTRQAKRVSGIRDNNASPASLPQPKTRQATQQAGIKINSPPPSPPDARTSRQATRARLVNSATPKENDQKAEAKNISDNQEIPIILPPQNQESNRVTPEEHHEQIEPGPTTSPPENQAPPTVVPPVNSEKKESPMVNPTISNPTPQNSCGVGIDMKTDSSINFSMNDLWTDPCIEFAVKTLTGAIPFTDLNKVQNFTAPLEVPLQEFWTDPCIEFAVKTLTGAIPVGEDDYLPHRTASSSNTQGLHSPDVLSKPYETGHKIKQQDSVFPMFGNGSLQKSGKFVNGSNGQCSRSRFSQ